MSKILKDWELQMYSAMRVAMNESKFDVLNLYLKMEKASKEFLENKQMKEGDSFAIPMEDGAYFEMKFHRKYSTLDLINPNKTIIHAITEENSYKNEYRYLQGYSQALKNNNMGIGPHFPENLKTFLKNVKPGEVLVFDNGKSFVCEKNDGNVKLVQTSNNTTIPNISAFMDSKNYIINTGSDISIQNFYANVRDNYNDDIRCRVTTSNKAQELINRCYAGLDSKTKKVKIGPNEFRVKKSMISKEMKWFDKEGNQIPEEKVKVLLGWLDTAPTLMDFERDEKDPRNEFDDNMVRAEVDKLFEQGEFDSAQQLLSNYCLLNNEELAINIKSYIQNNGTYEATSFIFRNENDECKIFKVTYENNDFTKDPASIQSVDIDEFIKFCEAKYDEKFIRIENDIKAEILKKYPKYHGQFFEKAVHEIAEKEMSHDIFIEQEITKVRKDISHLTKSYIDKEDLER